RISDARTERIKWCRESNPPGAGGWGFGYDDDHYQDGPTGAQTSPWDAMHLVFLARVLETPILDRSMFVWQHEDFDARAGQFNLPSGIVVTLAELKAALDARILELGLSRVLLEEYFSLP